MKAYLGKPPKKWTLPNSEVDSDGEVEILCSPDEQSGLFEVRTPDDEFDYDCDNNSDIRDVVESAYSTSLVEDNAERVDGPINKQSSTIGEQG